MQLLQGSLPELQRKCQRPCQWLESVRHSLLGCPVAFGVASGVGSSEGRRWSCLVDAALLPHPRVPPWHKLKLRLPPSSAKLTSGGGGDAALVGKTGRRAGGGSVGGAEFCLSLPEAAPRRRENALKRGGGAFDLPDHFIVPSPLLLSS